MNNHTETTETDRAGWVHRVELIELDAHGYSTGRVVDVEYYAYRVDAVAACLRNRSAVTARRAPIGRNVGTRTSRVHASDMNR